VSETSVTAVDAHRRPSRHSFNRLSLALLAVLSVALFLGNVAAQEDARDTTETTVTFDIGAQPLSKALTEFSAATGIEIVVDARETIGRQSLGVRGTMKPHEALVAILAGSGLAPQDLTSGTAYLVPVMAAPATSRPFLPAEEPAFYAVVQRALMRVLCQDEATRPGRYRLALKVWIDASGTAVRAKRLDTTGNPRLDSALDAVIRRVDLGRAAPADLAQPLAVLILPQQQDRCGPAPALRRAAN
jgi:hypothetical protein